MNDLDKVDRALEMLVIDWLQFGSFEENLIKRPDGDDMRQLALQLISKRKKANEELKRRVNIAIEALEDINLNTSPERKASFETRIGIISVDSSSALNKLREK